VFKGKGKLLERIAKGNQIELLEKDKLLDLDELKPLVTFTTPCPPIMSSTSHPTALATLDPRNYDRYRSTWEDSFPIGSLEYDKTSLNISLSFVLACWSAVFPSASSWSGRAPASGSLLTT
jgi:hypothetical protein